MRAELVLKRTSRDTNIRAFAIHARGEGRKNVYHGFARRYTTFPSPPSLLFHHFRSPRSRVPLSTGRRFPIREQGASFQRRCFAFTFPSPSSPLKQRRVALSPRSLCRARFLLSFPCVLFDHSLRQLAPSFSFRSFLLSLDRNPFPPSGMIYPLEGKERKTWIASSSSMIGERINLLKLCFIKFGLEKVEIGDVFSSSMMIHWRERVNFFSSSHEIFPRTEILEIERNWKNALIVNLSSSSMTTCLWSLYVLDVEHASKEVKGTELGETGMGSLQNDRKALRAFSRRIRGPLERFLERLGALRDRRNFVEARLWLVETCRHG